MIVMACTCGARSDQAGPDAHDESCWACERPMTDTGIRWNRAVPIGEVVAPIVADIAKRQERAA